MSRPQKASPQWTGRTQNPPIEQPMLFDYADGAAVVTTTNAAQFVRALERFLEATAALLNDWHAQAEGGSK